jgi:hypothetical protein
MKYVAQALISIQIGLFILLSLALFHSCEDEQHRKTKPHKDIGPEFRELTKEYLQLSSDHGIYHNRLVPIGLVDLSFDYPTIGTCWLYEHHRDIDIDSTYWKKASPLGKKMLTFHEMSHCYCGRGHDYGPKAEFNYSSGFTAIFNKILVINKDKAHGYYKDGCPLSIMYPTTVADACYSTHYNDYIKEMFNNCKAY